MIRLTEKDVDRLASAILKAAAFINNPKIQEDLDESRLTFSRVYACRYAKAVVNELSQIESERASQRKFAA